MTFALQTSIRSVGKESGTAGAGVYQYPLNWRSTDALNLTEGDGQYEADGLCSFSDTLADAAEETYNILSLLRPSGAETVPNLAFYNVKVFGIRNLDTSAGNLVVGGASSNVFAPMFGADAHQIVIPPGAEIIFPNPINGWNVTAIAKNLKFAASGGIVNYEWFLAGVKTEVESSSSSQ